MNKIIELEVDKVVIHHWEKETNKGGYFPCNYWDCPHTIRTGDIYYSELYPSEQTESFCPECSAFFMAQALNKLIDNWCFLPDKEALK
jgi:hypothetical protein